MVLSGFELSPGEEVGLGWMGEEERAKELWRLRLRLERRRVLC